MANDPIVWKESPLNSATQRGYLVNRSGGLVHVWNVYWHGTGNAADPKYLVDCKLPGIKQRVPVENAEAGKARALRQLKIFLSWSDEAPGMIELKGVQDSDTFIAHTGGNTIVVDESHNIVVVKANGYRFTVTDCEGLSAGLAAARTVRNTLKR